MKRRSKLIMAMALLCIVGLWSVSWAGEKAKNSQMLNVNLLLNGGFEEELSRGWGTGQYAAGKDLWWNSNNCDSYIQRDGKQPHSGKYSLHLVNRSAKAPHTYGTTQQLLSIVPGQRYRVTLWAKGKQLTSPGSVSIVVDEAWSVRPIVLPQGSFDWTQFTGTFSLGTKQTSLRLLMEGPGEVWLDDLTIEPATDSEPVVNAPVAASEMLNQVDEESDLPADLDLEASGERFDESGQRADLDAGGGAGDVFAEFKRGDSEKPNFDDLPGTGEPGSMDPTDGPGVVSHPGDPDRKPLTVSVSASSARVPASTWVRFVARARGGTKPYTFAWTDDGVAKNSRSANLSLLWKKKSVNVVGVLVTDSSNPPLQARANVTIIVDEPSKEPSRPVLSLQSVILSPASVSPGGQVKVNAIFRLQHWPASAAVIEATFAMETSSRGSVVRKVFRFRCPVKNGQAYSNVWVRFPTRADARPGPIRAAVKLRVSGLVARKMGHGEIREAGSIRAEPDLSGDTNDSIRYWRGVQVTKMPDGTVQKSPANLMSCHNHARNEHYLKDVDTGEIFGRGKSKYHYTYKNGNHHLAINDRSQPSMTQDAVIDFFETEDTLTGKGTSNVELRDPSSGRVTRQSLSFSYQLKRVKN